MTKPHSNHHEPITDRRYRVIHSLCLEFGPLTQLVIQIDKDGHAKKKTFEHDKEREIDLRVGDVLKFENDGKFEQKEITKIAAYRESWCDRKPVDPDGFLMEKKKA